MSDLLNPPKGLIQVIGPSIAYIAVGGQYILIDAELIPLMLGVVFYLSRNLSAGRYYPYAIQKVEGKRARIPLKNMVMGVSGRLVAHVNGNHLDCRSVNLRLITRAQRFWQVGKRKHNTSGFIGIAYRKRKKRWDARCTNEGVTYYLGSSKSKEEAARLYDDAIRQLRGEYAHVNFD